MESHNIDRISVFGYELCSVCQTPVVMEVSARTGGRCTKCWASTTVDRTKVLEVVGLGRRARVTVGASTAKKDKPPANTKKLAERCKHKALRRLRALFPDLYDVLLAEERAKHGLEPWPIERAAVTTDGLDAEATLAFAEVYHALSERGVDVDGLVAGT
jgi:hypothetical protein